MGSESVQGPHSHLVMVDSINQPTVDMATRRKFAYGDHAQGKNKADNGLSTHIMEDFFAVQQTVEQFQACQRWGHDVCLCFFLAQFVWYQ